MSPGRSLVPMRAVWPQWLPRRVSLVLGEWNKRLGEGSTWELEPEPPSVPPVQGGISARLGALKLKP